MRKTIVASMLALAAFAAGSEAKAAGWGLHSGDTLNAGDNMLYGEVGWPSLDLGFQHGMSPKVDLGFRFSLLYGYEYTPWTHVGLGMRVPIRIGAVKRDKWSFLFHIDPGIKFASFSGGNGYCTGRGCAGWGWGGGWGGFGYRGGLQFGLWVPLGLEFGIHVTREAHIQFGMEIPLYINFTNGVFGSIPILFGPGFEYTIDQHMAVGINTKFGPSITAWEGASFAAFGFITQVYFAYRL